MSTSTTLLSLNMVNLTLLTGALDHSREIHQRKIEREVDASQHDCEEDVPAEDASDEREGACRFLELGGKCGAAVGELEESACEKTEGGDEGEEDEEEDEVGADGADEVDEAEQAHADHEVGWFCALAEFAWNGSGCDLPTPTLNPTDSRPVLLAFVGSR